MTALLSRAETVKLAAEWLTMQNPVPSPIIPALRREFDLSPAEAVEAIRELTLIRGRAL